MLTISESHVSLSFLSASLSLLCREVYENEMLVVQQGFGNKAGTHTHERVRRKWFWYYLGSSGSMDNKMLVMEFRDPLICFFLT